MQSIHIENGVNCAISLKVLVKNGIKALKATNSNWKIDGKVWELKDVRKTELMNMHTELSKQMKRNSNWNQTRR